MKKPSNKELIDVAKNLGYKEEKGVFSHNQLVFRRKNRYMTYDMTGHIGGYWKLAKDPAYLGDSKRRKGTFNKDLSKRLGN